MGGKTDINEASKAVVIQRCIEARGASSYFTDYFVFYATYISMIFW